MTVQERVQEHYQEALSHFKPESIVGCFLQGSQNYGLETECSDVDTKLVVVPTFQDIAMNRKPVSTTHVRANEEHTDWKDLRLMLQTFRKQNLNFIEILFTPYFVLNPMYQEDWNILVERREEIAHYSPYQAVKTMKGIAEEKYHAMEHEYPSKLEVLAKYGYDPKQLHHLLRVEEFLYRFTRGESYDRCLRPNAPQYLVEVKKGFYSLDDARCVADRSIGFVRKFTDEFCESNPKTVDPKVDELLDRVQLNIMETAVRKELEQWERSILKIPKASGVSWLRMFTNGTYID